MLHCLQNCDRVDHSKDRVKSRISLNIHLETATKSSITNKQSDKGKTTDSKLRKIQNNKVICCRYSLLSGKTTDIFFAFFLFFFI